MGQGEGLEIGKNSDQYQDEVATVFLSESDMEEMGLEEGSSVEVSGAVDSCVVKCQKADLDEGLAFMPLGPWASFILSTDTSGTGMPQSKGLEVEISKTEKNVKSLEKMMKSFGGKR